MTQTMVHLPPPGAQAGRERMAFTLIELLVVITIIAVLAALLLVVIGMVREMAKTTRCGAQLRQMAIAMEGYIGDNEGVIPLTISSGPPYQDIWYVTLAGSVDGAFSDNFQTEADLRRGSIINGCPNWKGTDPSQSCYVMNNQVLLPGSAAGSDGYSDSPFQQFTASAVTHKTTRLLFADGVNAFSWRAAIIGGVSKIDDRHRRRANIAFFDYHIETMNAADAFLAVTNPP